MPTIELIVTINDNVAIVELDPSSSTAEDILVLTEVQLGVACSDYLVEVESPPQSGAFKRIGADTILSSVADVVSGASVRLVSSEVAVTSDSSAGPSPVVPTPPSGMGVSPSPAPLSALPPQQQQQQQLTPDDLIRLLMSGGTPPPSAAAATTTAAGNNYGHQNRHGHQNAAAPLPLPLDPLDPDYQRKLYEQIQRENVEENLALAMEHTPEAFARVVMLYVPASVNKHKITAFVDSGAQMTIMNVDTAEKCGIMHLLDKRFAGTAKGVGSAKILGRVHMAMVNIAGIVIPMSISVLEEQSMEFLIGLDQLRRHQMCIDLKKNVLRIGEDAEVAFLGEGELPEHLTERGQTAAAEAAAAKKKAEEEGAKPGEDDNDTAKSS